MSTYSELKKHFIDKNIKVFPIVKNGKTPLIESWQNDCSCDLKQISYWLENAKDCNWGMPCTPNDLFVIDIDVHNVNGFESCSKLLKSLGINEIDTLCQQTPSGGMHIIYKSDDELRNVANTANSFKDYPGIDIRTDGYIAVYPSKINDKVYTFVSSKEIKEMPKALKEFILSQKSIIKTEKKKEDYIKPDKVEEGNRDTELFNYICNLYYKTRLSQSEISVLANDFNENVCNPPLPKRTVSYKVKKAFKKDRGKCLILWIGDKDYNEEEE